MNGIDVVMGMEDKIQVWETQGRTVVLVSVDGELMHLDTHRHTLHTLLHTPGTYK